MSYDASEQSVASGAPVELFEFRCGSDVWRYTSAAAAIEYMAQTFSPETIERSDFNVTTDATRSELTIRTVRNNAFVSQFIASPLEGEVQVTIYRGHDGDYITLWKGVLTSVVFPGTSEAEIKCSPLNLSLQRQGLSRRYQRQCNYPLYSAGCQVVSDNWKITGVLANVNGLVLTCSVFATKTDGWFVAGKIVIGKAKRLITNHTGSTVTISHPIIGLAAGTSFTAYAGCDHSLATCKSKFDNVINYGGQPYIPNKNPFAGDAIA